MPKIQALQFVDMRELLPDNIALSERLGTLPQSLQFVHTQTTFVWTESTLRVGHVPLPPTLQL